MHRSLASQQCPSVRFPLVDCFRLSPSSRLLSRAYIQAKRVQAVQHVSNVASVRDLRSSGSTRIALQVQLRPETSVSKKVRNWPSLTIINFFLYRSLYLYQNQHEDLLSNFVFVCRYNGPLKYSSSLFKLSDV